MPTTTPAPGTAGERQPEVRTEEGLLQGLSAAGVSAFKGIPFAAAPVGSLRWRPPQPPAAWDGVRTAHSIGPAPVQPQPPRSNIMWHTNFDDSRALVMSEDCLYLNVWTPEPSRSAALPVMVFLHGGANRFGHGGQEVHDGAAVSGRGVVVVTVNMRLGVLGFLAHPELAAEDELAASGNYALLDVVAALEWVRRNISAFGGDPARVTLAGNSAGAAIITHLMAAPAARDLFRAVIGQSSAGIFRAEGPMPDQAEAQEEGVAALGQLGGLPLAQLRRLSPVSFLLNADLGPVRDGRLLTEDTEDVFRAAGQARVPMLLGTTTDEGVNYTGADAVDRLRRRVTTGPHATALARVYPVGDPEQAAASARAFTSETRFAYPVWRWARTQVETVGAPVWLYRFDHEPPLPADLDLAAPPDGRPGYGVYHTSELPYTGDNLWSRRWGWTGIDRDLARRMGDAWARFVTDHDPSGGDLPTWPRYDGTANARVMVFGDRVEAAGVHRVEALELLDSLPRPL